MNAPILQKRLVRHFLQRFPKLDLRNMALLASMVVGLVLSGNVSLDGWALYFATKAEFAASRVRSQARLLGNERLHAAAFFLLFIRPIFVGSAKIVYLVLDTSVLWNRFCLVRVAVAYMGRAIPLSWCVLRKKSASAKFTQYEPVLERVVGFFPPSTRVVLLADRGFGSKQLFAWLDSARWHWRIRIKGTMRLLWSNGRSFEPNRLPVPMGKALFRKDKVRIANAPEIGYVSLAAGWPFFSNEKWFVSSDEAGDERIFKEYGIRFAIEEGFLDDKSGGFHVEESRLDDPEKLERLFLVLAIATVCLVSEGISLTLAQKRRMVDSHFRRGRSYFNIGWSWIRRQIGLMYDGVTSLFKELLLPFIEDPEPIFVSRRENARRQKRRNLEGLFAEVDSR